MSSSNPNPAPNAYSPNTVPTMTASPAYTLSGRHAKKNQDNVPAPNAYTPGLNQTQMRSPAYTLSGRNLDMMRNTNPGPATYAAEKYKATGDTAVAFSLSSRHAMGSKAATPGPAEYRPQSAPHTTRSPAYTMKSRHGDGKID